jgi:uncharacterized protein DUF6933
MIIRVSAKLGKKIHLAPASCLPANANPLADWSAHLFTAERVQYLMLTNTAALYSMVMYGKGITDDCRLLDSITSHMGQFMREDGQGLLFTRLIAPSTAHVSFSKALNRAVTGSINELVWQAKVHLSAQQRSPYDTSMLLNEVPMSYLGYDTPKQAFLKLGPTVEASK